MKTILIFAGTRPEIIKMAPLVREFRAREAQSTGDWTSHFCFSGQHLEIALPFLEFLQVRPDSQLDLMSPGQSLGQLTSRAAGQLDSFFDVHKDAAAALVQGDTTTAFVAALLSFYHHVPVGHVEAGLRTLSTSEPFPEELNRRMISKIAKWNFAPTEAAKRALLLENTVEGSIAVTGNTGIDSLLWTLDKQYDPVDPLLLTVADRRLILVTLHRRENIGLPVESICAALVDIANEFQDREIVFPVHPNPSIGVTVRRVLAGRKNIHLVSPMSYGDLVWTMKRTELILTDSGGIQEEAPTLGKPVLVLRNDTERPEAVEYGTSTLVGHDRKKIVTVAREFLTGSRLVKTSVGPNPYGDGKSALRIADVILNELIPSKDVTRS